MQAVKMSASKIRQRAKTDYATQESLGLLWKEGESYFFASSKNKADTRELKISPGFQMPPIPEGETFKVKAKLHVQNENGAHMWTLIHAEGADFERTRPASVYISGTVQRVGNQNVTVGIQPKGREAVRLTLPVPWHNIPQQPKVGERVLIHAHFNIKGDGALRAHHVFVVPA